MLGSTRPVGRPTTSDGRWAPSSFRFSISPQRDGTILSRPSFISSRCRCSCAASAVQALRLYETFWFLLRFFYGIFEWRGKKKKKKKRERKHLVYLYDNGYGFVTLAELALCPFEVCTIVDAIVGTKQQKPERDDYSMFRSNFSRKKKDRSFYSRQLAR